MQELVVIIRARDELEDPGRLERCAPRAARAKVSGSRIYNPWLASRARPGEPHPSLRSGHRSALIREESRGGHTLETSEPDPEWGTKNVVTRKRDGPRHTTEPYPRFPRNARAPRRDKPTGEAATGTKTPVAAGDD